MSIILLLLFAMLCVLLNFIPVQFHAPAASAENDDLIWSLEKHETVTAVS